jgi:hypothetical protein
MNGGDIIPPNSVLEHLALISSFLDNICEETWQSSLARFDHLNLFEKLEWKEEGEFQFEGVLKNHLEELSSVKKHRRSFGKIINKALRVCHP